MYQLGLSVSSMLGGLFSRGVDSAPHSRENGWSSGCPVPCFMQTKCRGKSASSNTYGAGAPSRFVGERRLHKEQIEATHTHKDFTQLRAARMRKTLMLLVWIDSSSCCGAQEATVSLEPESTFAL